MRPFDIVSLAAVAVLVYIIVACGASLSGLVLPTMDSFWSQTVSQLIAALVGAWVGANAAYRYQRQKDEAEEFRRRAAAVNLAIHNLAQMYLAMRNYDDQMIAPVRSDPPKVQWYRLQASDIYVGQDLEFNYAELQFLAQSSDPGVIGSLAIEERRFANLRKLVDSRSRVHHEQMQPRMEAAGLVGTAMLAEVVAAAGPLIVGTLQTLTPPILTFVARGLQSTQDVARAVELAARPLCGTQRIVRFVPNPP